MTEPIYISKEPIRLDQAMKIANWVMSGAEAKWIIKEGGVLLNGKPCLERGHKLFQGDRVEFEDFSFEICLEEDRELPSKIDHEGETGPIEPGCV